MAICSKCGKTINNDSAFCPFCGEKVTINVESANSDNVSGSTSDTLTIKKQIPQKAVIGAIIAVISIALLASIAICEVKISKAKNLYAQGEFWKAYMQVHNIPPLGREELIRIKTAAYAGQYYDNYLTTKRIRLSSTSSKSKDAYQSAFWELTFGLHIDLREANREPSKLSDIELDEYQKFIDLFYSELLSMFHMSKTEADSLMRQFEKLDKVDDMKNAAYQWLDKNFF